MLFASLNIGRHPRTLRTLFGQRRVQGALAVSAFATLLSVMLAPNGSTSVWDWTRLACILAFGAGSILLFTLAQGAHVEEVDRQQRLIVAGVLIAATIALNLTFTLGATLVFSIGITVVALLAGRDRPARSPWLIVALLLAAIPIWVWSALQAWTWRLLLLFPLVSIAVIVRGHIRAAADSDVAPGDPLSQRAHRLAAWAGMLGAALLVVLVGIFTAAATGAIALGAIGLIALVALEAGTSGAARTDPRWSVALVDAAMAWFALCWIVSL